MARHLALRARHDERGATTVEYVGIVAFVAMLAVAVIALSTPVANSGKLVMDKAFCKIGAVFGGAGCTNAALPHYIPQNCTLSSTAKQYGGSVTIIVQVGGDTGYTIYRIRTRNDDGTYTDKYTVKTAGKFSGSYELGTPSAEADTGSGSTGTPGAKVSISGDFSTGSSYTFATQAEAEKFAKDNVASFGIDGLVDGGPTPDSTYYELGGGADVKGKAGPLSASAGGRAVLGLTTMKNGDKTYSLALTAKAAADLGIPLPAGLQIASAKGDVSLTVKADVTFNKDGNLVGIKGTGSFTAQAEGGVKLGYGKKPSTGKHAAPPKNTLTNVDLPFTGSLQAGESGSFTFDTTFLNPDGTYNSDQASQVGSAVSTIITGGTPTQAEKDALYTQINENSQITAQLNNYSKDEEKYGGKIKLVVVSIGAEGHVITTEESVQQGWYYNPVLGTWQENIACKA